MPGRLHTRGIAPHRLPMMRPFHIPSPCKDNRGVVVSKVWLTGISLIATTDDPAGPFSSRAAFCSSNIAGTTCWHPSSFLARFPAENGGAGSGLGSSDNPLAIVPRRFPGASWFAGFCRFSPTRAVACFWQCFFVSRRLFSTCTTFSTGT